MFDLAAHLGTRTRVVKNLERDGKPAAAIVASRVFPTTPDDLWNALTTPARIARWFLPVTGELRLGGRYQFQGNAGGTVTACEPTSRIEATWEFGGMVSWVTLTLEPTKGGTRLALEHVAHVDNDHWKQFGPGAVGVGWDMGFMGLAGHIISPDTAMTPEQGAAWTATDEAKAMIRTTSTDWGRAAIAAGQPEAEALAAAERTRAAYTGEPATET